MGLLREQSLPIPYHGFPHGMRMIGTPDGNRMHTLAMKYIIRIIEPAKNLQNLETLNDFIAFLRRET